METPPVQFAVTEDGVRIAYQAFGAGPITVVVPPLVSNVEVSWEQKRYRRVFEHLAHHLRVILFDKRGMGMSDSFEEAPTLLQRIADIDAVMEAEGVTRAHIHGLSEGGGMALAFAAHHPTRVDRIVIANSEVGPSHLERARDLGTAIWLDDAELDRRSQALIDNWGADTRGAIAWFTPSLAGDEDFASWAARFSRLSASQDIFRRQLASMADLDIGDAAKGIEAATLITHTIGDRVVNVGHARALAELIPDSDLHEFEGEDHYCWLAPYWREIVDTHIRFLTGSVVRSQAERRFAAILFTDVVGSTAATMTAGDEHWRATLDSHDTAARRVIESHRGRLVKGTGDGLLAIFDTPSGAIDAARALRSELDGLGLTIRAGIHAGEIEVRDDDIAGAAVNLAARVEQAAGDGEIYVTSTVRDLLLGSDYHFGDAGKHRLKGFDADWHLCVLI